MPTFIVYRHKVDIYNKTTTTNLAGQKKPTYTLSGSGQKCTMIPLASTDRTDPSYFQNEIIWIFVPADAPLDSGDRLYNLQDKLGNVLEAGPLEIKGIKKEPGYSGKIHHLMIRAQRVSEQ